MKRDTAETIAARALGWLAADDELLGTFMAATGTGIEDIRARAASPVFLASVLDFLTMDDRWIIRFCDDAGLTYDAPLQARQAMPGGGQVHWT